MRLEGEQAGLVKVSGSSAYVTMPNNESKWPLECIVLWNVLCCLYRAQRCMVGVDAEHDSISVAAANIECADSVTDWLRH